VDDPLYIFVHVPRTGGTTINGHLRIHLEEGVDLVHLVGEGEGLEDGVGVLERMSPEERSRIRVLAGHQVFYGIHDLIPGRDPRYITIIRDPATRALSVFNFRQATGRTEDDDVSFEEWVEGYPTNSTLKWFQRRLDAETVEEVMEILRSKFWFVGATEHLDEDLPSVFRAIGVPDEWVNLRVTPLPGDTAPDLSHRAHPFGTGEKSDQVISRVARLTPELADKIRGDNARDRRLHRFALRRRLKQPPLA
jgi:hypothetical protein